MPSPRIPNAGLSTQQNRTQDTVRTERATDKPSAGGEQEHQLSSAPRGSGTGAQRPRNLSKSPLLAYAVFEEGGSYKKFRKEKDKPVFRPSPESGKVPVDVPAYGKQQLYQSGRIHETITVSPTPTPGMLSHQLQAGELVKVLGWGKGPIDPDYPLAVGTSKPGQVCVTDGMAICMAVVVGATSKDGSQAKLKVFHIQPEMNPKGLQAVQEYVQKLKDENLTELSVGMHGGNQYPADATEKLAQEKATVDGLHALFKGADMQLNELGGLRGVKNTALGGVIQRISKEGEPARYGIRVINELVAPPAA